MGHMHLVLNHFPVVGLIICLALLGYGFMKNSDEVKVASLWLFAAIAVLTLGAYFTGEPAEELVEHMPGVKKAMIESHEEAGTVSLIFIELIGVLSIAGLVLYSKGKSLNANLMKGVFALSVIGALLVGYTANLGGQIRHTEIRADYSPAPESGKAEGVKGP